MDVTQDECFRAHEGLAHALMEVVQPGQAGPSWALMLVGLCRIAFGEIMKRNAVQTTNINVKDFTMCNYKKARVGCVSCP